ncbi:MAG TPA: class I SAM-dependent methyltransferase [Acidimicrobiales bacterium]|jgi:hypothetical protein
MGICKVCGGPVTVTHRGILLGRYEVEYFKCSACEFWCTEEPYWLEEAYSNAISTTDTGLVYRNLLLARRLKIILSHLFPQGPYVDWAGGCGMFVRLMRDSGFDFYWQDRYADNLLARGFEWDQEAGRRSASLVTAFEVLEHTPDPLAFFHEALSQTDADALFFTEILHPGAKVDPDWWYLAPGTGQHISFFSEQTLQKVAEILGMHLRSWGSFHLLTKQPVSQRRYQTAMFWAKAADALSQVPNVLSRGHHSLTEADNLTLIARSVPDGASPVRL